MALTPKRLLPIAGNATRDLTMLARLAVAASEPLHVVRYHAWISVLREYAREANGYRRSARGALKRRDFIRDTQRRGFTRLEIGQFIHDAARGRARCARESLDARRPVAVRQQHEAIAPLARAPSAQRRWQRMCDRSPMGVDSLALVASGP